MTVAERLEGLKPARRGGPCRMSVVLAELSVKDRAALLAALAVPVGDPVRLSNQQLADVLTSEGFRVHAKTVETHRKGGCSCEPVG